MHQAVKIFGIGLSKTGTTSLIRALEILGYSSRHLPRDVDFNQYDAFSDVSVALKYRTLDKFFPGSRFIYTVRNMPNWLASCERHFAKLARVDRIQDLRESLYRCTLYDEQAFRDTWQRHDTQVRSYFAQRPGDLLVLDICAGEGWGPLCAFLGHEMPGVAFPWANPAKITVDQTLPSEAYSET